MPVIRHLLTGLPAQLGPTAFMPVRAMTPSVFSLKSAQQQVLTGQPGTQGIPAPYPDGPVKAIGARKGSLLPAGGPGYAAGSAYMPARWYPALYYAEQHVYRAIGGVTVFSDNIMPVPAIDPRGLPAGSIGPAAFARSRQGASGTPTHPARPNRVIMIGARQIPWPRRIPPWPGWNE